MKKLTKKQQARRALLNEPTYQWSSSYGCWILFLFYILGRR